MNRQLKGNIRVLAAVLFIVIWFVAGATAFYGSAAETNSREAADARDLSGDARDVPDGRQAGLESAWNLIVGNAVEDVRGTDGLHDKKYIYPDVSDEGEQAEDEDIPDILILVNKTHDVPSDWSVDLVDLGNGQSIDSRAYEDLKAMIDDALALGLDPLICSSYRTEEKQAKLYEEKVSYFRKKGYSEEEARDLAAEYVAAPETSEHQLGLAVDICAESYQALETDQENTEVQQWLMANSYRYGFILRYPEDKTDVTGVTYEPWHYRYVGVEVATEIYGEGLCLEEYLESLSAS